MHDRSTRVWNYRIKSEKWWIIRARHAPLNLNHTSSPRTPTSRETIAFSIYHNLPLTAFAKGIALQQPDRSSSSESSSLGWGLLFVLEDLVVRSELQLKRGWCDGVSETRRFVLQRFWGLYEVMGASHARPSHWHTWRKSTGIHLTRRVCLQFRVIKYLQIKLPSLHVTDSDRFIIIVYISNYLHPSPGPGVA